MANAWDADADEVRVTIDDDEIEIIDKPHENWTSAVAAIRLSFGLVP